jgi:hypothetical protein
MAEIGLAILIVGLLIFMDPERARWAAQRVRELISWLSSS